jgi:hypothetical protein
MTWMLLGRPLIALAAAAATLCGARADARRYADMTDEQVSRAIAAAHAVEPLGARIQAVTEPFLGTPYVLGNMGEGPDGDGRDKDPRYNVKTADCTTFVEHAMAFALSRDLPAARKLLDEIRYAQGNVNYGARRHWPDAQWVPGLIDEGFLEDVTAEVAGSDAPVQRSKLHIDRAALSASAHEELKQNLKPEEVPAGDFGVPYVALDRVAAVKARLQPGMVLNVVKEPKEGLLVRISHQGLIVAKDGQLFVRNASSVGPKAVVDETLKDFTARQAQAKSWRTAGFNFLRVRNRAAPKG